jgi:hypothetical protein
MAIEKKIKILGAVVELPAKQHRQFSLSPKTSILQQNLPIF